MLVQTKAEMKRMLALCEKASILGVDTETTGLDWKKNKLVGICLYPDGHNEGFFIPSPAPKDALGLSQLLGNSSRKVFHNAKFDLHFLKSAGYVVGGEVYDTYVMAKLWNENRANHKLKDLAVELVDAHAADDQDKLKEWLEANHKTWEDIESVPVSIMAKYGANDPLITVKLYHVLLAKLVQEGIPLELVEREMRVLVIAWEMERKGILIDKPFLEKYSLQLAKAQEVLLPTMLCHVPAEFVDFNPAADAQVLGVLRSLGWESTKKTDKGKDSVDKGALKAFDHPFAKTLLEYRRIGTIKGTFVDGILERAIGTGKDWTIHSNYNVAGATTGRWSSNDPNLQNVDKKSDARKAFVPRKGTRLWLFDYKQIEPVLFAHYSGSGRLQKAFQDGLDYHSLNASAAFGIPYDKIDPEGKERKIAKNLGLAIMYQAGADKAAQMMGVSSAEGKALRDRYFETFPEVKAFQKEVTKVIEDRAVAIAKASGRLEIRSRYEWIYDGALLPLRQVQQWTFVDKSAIEEVGYIKTVFGRRRRLTIDNAYKGLNALIQMTAADLFKEAMKRCGGIQIPLLQVHDELGFELEMKGDLEKAKAIKAAMESLQEYFPKVPIRVDVAIAESNWMEEKGVTI